MTVSFLIWCVGATEIRLGVKKGEIEARGREIMVLNTTRNKKRQSRQKRGGDQEEDEQSSSSCKLSMQTLVSVSFQLQMVWGLERIGE